MAFNPFHSFRKRQKTLLAGVAIMCMFLFVLQFGKGDIFDKLGIGGRKADNPLVTKIYGKDVVANDIYDLRRGREAAALFIQTAFQIAGGKIQDNMKQVQEGGQDTDTIQKRMTLQKQQGDLQKAFYSLLIPTVQTRLDDLLDMLMWRRQADRLGITITNSDIDKFFAHATLDLVDPADVHQLLLDETLQARRDRSDRNPLTQDMLYQALGDEIRVRLAESALLGLQEGMPTQSMLFGLEENQNLKTTSAPPSPLEFWDFFVKNRTSREIVVLGVSVKDYDGKVKDQPTEKELRRLYERYRNVEPSPLSNKPGFKEPHREKLEWVSARADTKHYTQWSETVVESVLASAATNPWPAVNLAFAVAGDYRKECEKAKYSFFETSRYKLPSLTERNFVLPLYTSLTDPDSVALLLATGALGSPLPVLATYQVGPYLKHHRDMAGVVEREKQKRLQAGTMLLLSGSNPMSLTPAILWAQTAQETQFLPMESLGKELIQRTKNGMAQDQMIANMTRLQQDLETLQSKNQDAGAWIRFALTDYSKVDRGLKVSAACAPLASQGVSLASFVAQELWVSQANYGLTTHEVLGKPLSQNEMNSSKALAPLKNIYARLAGTRDLKAERFGEAIFDEKAPKYAPRQWPPPQGGSRFDLMWSSEEEPYLFWKTEDVKAYVPSFAEAKARVEKAWRFDKARDLARVAAYSLADKAKKTDGDVPQLRDLSIKESLSFPFTELRAVALLNPKVNAMGNSSRDYEPFKFPDPITNPRPDFLKELSDLKDMGNTVVSSNLPDDVFYVATLVGKQEPSIERFYDTYRDAKSLGGRDGLLDLLMRERRDKYRQDLLKQLRAEAAPLNDDGTYEVEESVRQRLKARGE